MDSDPCNASVTIAGTPGSDPHTTQDAVSHSKDAVSPSPESAAPPANADASARHFNEPGFSDSKNGQPISYTNDAFAADTPKIFMHIEFQGVAKGSKLTATMIVKDPTAKAALVQILNELPGEAPAGVAPARPTAIEREYLDQLRTVYAEAAGSTFHDVDAVFLDAEYGDHLRDQRTRYFEAEAFKRFHRDNTDRRMVGQFQEDIYQGVVDVHRETHPRLIDRLGAVMKHASSIEASILGRSARIPVKQGICHHLANEGRLKWTR